jgi:hypothetical protein
MAFPLYFSAYFRSIEPVLHSRLHQAFLPLRLSAVQHVVDPDGLRGSP